MTASAPLPAPLPAPSAPLAAASAPLPASVEAVVPALRGKAKSATSILQDTLLRTGKSVVQQGAKRTIGGESLKHENQQLAEVETEELLKTLQKQLESIQESSEPDRVQIIADIAKASLALYSLWNAGGPIEIVEKIKNVAIHALEQFGNPSMVLSFIATTIAGEGSGPTDVKNVVRNIANHDLFKLFKKKQEEKITQIFDNSEKMTKGKFLLLLTTALAPHLLSEEEKQHMLALVGGENVPIHAYMQVLSLVETRLFSFKPVEKELLDKTLRPLNELFNIEQLTEKTTPEEKHGELKRQIAKIFTDPEKKQQEIQALKSLHEQKLKTENTLETEENGIKLIFSFVFTGIAISALQNIPNAVDRIAELIESRQGREWAERDPQNNRFYNELELQKPTLERFFGIFGNLPSVAIGFRRWASQQESIPLALGKIASLLGKSAMVASVMPVASSPEAVIEPAFGISPKATCALGNIHNVAGSGALTKYFGMTFLWGLAGRKAELVEQERAIMDILASKDLPQQKLNQLKENGCINEITLQMKFKKPGDDDYRTLTDHFSGHNLESHHEQGVRSWSDLANTLTLRVVPSLIHAAKSLRSAASRTLRITNGGYSELERDEENPGTGGATTARSNQGEDSVTAPLTQMSPQQGRVRELAATLTR
jgi:hypothetical protein